MRILKEKKIDEKIEEILEAKISWRFDSNFFNVVYKSEKGCKAMTYSNNLKKFHSPSLYDE